MGEHRIELEIYEGNSGQLRTDGSRPDFAKMAGDVNGKGHADLVIGACGYDDYTGRAYLCFGEGE